MGTATIFLRRVFGKQKYQLRWHFFAWSAALGKILTIDNLQKMEGVNCELALYVQERWMVNQSFIITLPNG